MIRAVTGPYRDMSEATVCECGHRFDRHGLAADLATRPCIAMVRRQPRGGRATDELCDCQDFMPSDDPEDSPDYWLHVNAAIDRRLGK